MPDRSQDATTQFEVAKFTPLSGRGANVAIPVHFNPVSLQYIITNTQRTGRGTQTQQYVSQSTAKLSMDLLFDTTDTGEDVRIATEKIALLMEPNNEHTPPQVVFSWGVYEFKGVVDSYRETLDFFSSSGVPLRASLSISLSKQDLVFQPNFAGQVSQPKNRLNELMGQAVDIPPSGSLSPSEAARQAGDQRAAAEIARQNNLENLRAPADRTMTVTGGESSTPASNFAPSGGGGGTGATSTSELRSGSRRSSSRLDPERLRPDADSVSVATDSGAAFNEGGQALMQDSANRRADTGTNRSLKDVLDFDAED
jgi:hypothetical protein